MYNEWLMQDNSEVLEMTIWTHLDYYSSEWYTTTLPNNASEEQHSIFPHDPRLCLSTTTPNTPKYFFCFYHKPTGHGPGQGTLKHLETP